MTEIELSNKLKQSKKLEGGLFSEISVGYCGRDYVARRDLYTVKNDKVYSIENDGSLYATGDSLENIERACHRIGKYNPNEKNQSVFSNFSYSEINEKLGL